MKELLNVKNLVKKSIKLNDSTFSLYYLTPQEEQKINEKIFKYSKN